MDKYVHINITPSRIGKKEDAKIGIGWASLGSVSIKEAEQFVKSLQKTIRRAYTLEVNGCKNCGSKDIKLLGNYYGLNKDGIECNDCGETTMSQPFLEEDE